MLLQNKRTGNLIKVMDTTTLVNPVEKTISGKAQEGQEEQAPEEIAKDDLIFPSGENLPLCWLDADYRQATAPGGP
jgi:hypothetical protein